ncbi:MAG TPA: helix-turn-helix transcriptional regulator [Longimicrobiales bacterium]|nr:helix-turn-helix transcriptional regulator [Longimicrobiales bacterium]
MSTTFQPATLVRMARARAGLSQRAMAARASTAQSVVARIEIGVTDPTGDTLVRLLEAAGFELRCALSPRPVLDSHMLDDVGRILSLTPEERLIEVRNFAAFEAAARLV